MIRPSTTNKPAPIFSFTTRSLKYLIKNIGRGNYGWPAIKLEAIYFILGGSTAQLVTIFKYVYLMPCGG